MSQDEPAQPPSDLPSRFGRYVLLSHLGRGGMADIYRAKVFGAGGFAKTVVVKRVLPSVLKQQSAVKMFMDEAKLSAVLQHMNIAQVLDFGEHQGEYFIAMEFLHGKDLNDILLCAAHAGRRISIPIACLITMEVLKGLDYAHRARSPAGEALNLVHRDVNPSNVLITFEGEVKLLDFGVAAISADVTAGTDVRGKAGYIPPEQLTKKKADGRGDLFALGVTLFELLSQKRAFEGATVMDVLKKTIQLKTQPLRLAEVAPDIPEQLCAIVDKSVLFDPAQRFQSAPEFLDALGEFLLASGQRVSSRDLSVLMGELYSPDVCAPPVDPPVPAEFMEQAAPETKATVTYSVREPGGLSMSGLAEEDVYLLLASGKFSLEAEVSRGGGPYLGAGAFPALAAATNAAAQKLLSQREKLAPPRYAGELSQNPPLRVLARLMTLKATGRVHFESAHHHKEMYLKDGSVIAVRTNLANERLGAFVIGTGRFERQVWNGLLEGTRPFAGRLCDALVANKVLSSGELAELLRQHRQAAVLSVLAWDKGRFAFYEGELPRADNADGNLGDITMLTAGVREHYTLERLRQTESDFFDKPLHQNLQTTLSTENLGFSGPEVRCARALTGGKSVKEALEEFGQANDELVLRRVALVLVETEAMGTA